MAHRRRKPAVIHTTPQTPAGLRCPRALWREAGRRAVLGLAGSTGGVLVAILEWWLRTR
ncbi:hypothetical protein [Streptomyces sp. NBC_01334]|uniref:hypothetical protein n=1 Tax=Streptomyces sp. NBC_01334 TaxID=2903827 RepID=UPI002E1576B1|nr:hypothetical protein OG736_46785 [Streptomyces sp. NBC_01334]